MPHATALAFAARLPLSQDLHSYYVNVHRDWCWGAEENTASHAVVAAALEGRGERLLVLGAGAGRLAYDLHQQSARGLTVALDINPLLLLVAERVVSGGRVELFEFPIAPRTAADVAVRRELAAPAPARPGLELVFADAFRAPFAAQSFDAVVTPWLIDIVDLDFESVALAVNRLLAPGGRWVNFGSLAFPWRRPGLRYGPEEVRDVVTEAGFEVGLQRDVALPYMRSPASRHGRVESVAVFAADKRQRGPREPAESSVPAWLRDASLPVPRSDSLALAADASRIQAVLLALVDGRRSIDELARIVAEQGLLPGAQAQSAVRGLLERLHHTAARADRT
jgi:SAM-dependent methyltransferase